MFEGLRKAVASRGRAAVTWHDGRAVLARATLRDQPAPRLRATVSDVGTDEYGRPALASLRLDGEPLQRVPVSAVLPDGRYQLLLEELPNAPRGEMHAAMGWRIRDRIDVALDDAVIELLEMPQQARGGKKLAYAVVASREVVQNQIAGVKGAGLNLDTIELPELCMRNIAVRLPQDAEGVAFLHFTADSGLLTITRQGVLYLIRRIDIGMLQLDRTPTTQVHTGLIPSVCLELQRSLDYYEAHYDLPSISTLVLGPGAGTGPLQQAIANQLGLKVGVLDLNELFDFAEPLSEEAQKECLFAIGAALRTDSATGWE